MLPASPALDSRGLLHLDLALDLDLPTRPYVIILSGSLEYILPSDGVAPSIQNPIFNSRPPFPPTPIVPRQCP